MLATRNLLGPRSHTSPSSCYTVPALTGDGYKPPALVGQGWHA
ncbi:hypothetical protein SNOG_09888 [Parastagonospora nodorum SN15]|uniref:Uncharacterized protein n=1 Tax=Phaeosphaeria nodorum (strain SN15 / ATCC MYA-4574 / FGSC 10173) TaxID=321614 RepID=Q0UEC6_PHANO|nr:hypothetical protein SNOG_09888 [Parastagonospora nodorum SN15]EAT83153.1 hypothetical protein SNOG_09888 [Parastagonospora nodorum SN15]